MRVLFDGYWWCQGPTANRSVQRDVVAAWARRFPADEVVVALRRGHRDRAEDLPPGSQPVTTRARPHAVANALELGPLAARTRADVVVAHNYTPLTGPSVTFVHDAMFHDHPEWFTRAERTYFAPMLPLARRALVRATSTETEAARMHRHESRGAPVSAVGLAVPSALAGAEPRALPEAADLDGWSLTVGRLNARKNLAAVIAGVAAATCTTPRTPLLVVGSSEHSGMGAELPPQVRSLVEAGLVRFLGRVEDDQLAWLYGGASLTVSLSRDEGFGLPPLEATWFGSPVLVSDIAVYRETVGEVATLVSPDATPEVVARAVESAWGRSPTTEQQAGLRERWSWSRTVEQLRALTLERLGPVA